MGCPVGLICRFGTVAPNPFTDILAIELFFFAISKTNVEKTDLMARMTPDETNKKPSVIIRVMGSIGKECGV